MVFDLLVWYWCDWCGFCDYVILYVGDVCVECGWYCECDDGWLG